MNDSCDLAGGAGAGEFSSEGRLSVAARDEDAEGGRVDEGGFEEVDRDVVGEAVLQRVG